MGDFYSYDASRMANFGRDTSKAYHRFKNFEIKLSKEINDALEAGISPIKIAHDLFGRCSDREEQHNLLAVLSASVQMDHIPESVLKPFEKGIFPKRV